MSKRAIIKRIAIAFIIFTGMLLFITCIAIWKIDLFPSSINIYALYRDFIKNIVPLLTLVVAVVTCILACRIPFLIMQNQIYTDLMHEYRSTEMLKNRDKIIGICDYGGDYQEEKCRKKCQVLQKCRKLKKYEEEKDRKDIIEKEIFCIEKSTWQSVSQWYWHLANLLYTRKYFGNQKRIRKLTKTNFTEHDSDIICIIYHLNHGLDKYCYRKPVSKFTKLLKKLPESVLK